MANSLNIDLTGKVVILSKENYKGTEEDRKFKCETGFGCSSFTRGTAIFGYFVKDGERARIRGYDIEKIVKEAE